MRRLVTAILVILIFSATYAHSGKAGIDSILSRDACTKTADVAILAKSASSGKVIYSKNADKLMIPASNMKIVTAMAVLHYLDSTFTFDTVVSHTGKRTGSVINGDLVIKGNGDPHFVTEDMFILVNEIRKRGIKRITGDIVLDDSYFDKERFPSGWRPSKQRRAYEAPLGALSLNFNSFTISIFPPGNASGKAVVSLDPQTDYFKLDNRVKVVARGRTALTLAYKKRRGGGETVVVAGQVVAGKKEKIYYRSVKNPISYFGLTLISYLNMVGVQVDGSVKHKRLASALTELFVRDSKPLYEQIVFMNKFSNNFMAEHLVKTLGAELVSRPGSTRKGVAKIEQFLKSQGLTSKSFRISDGSGFSSGNRLTVSLIVKMLERGYQKWKGGAEFLTSLALMGKDGSVQERLKKTRKTIRVKTGTLNSVSALSGYYPDSTGDIIIFSILFNNIPCENGEVLYVQHRLLKELERVNARAK